MPNASPAPTRVRPPRFTAPRDAKPILDLLVRDSLDALEWSGLVDRTRTAKRVEHRLPESAWRIAMLLLRWHRSGQVVYPSIAELVERDIADGHASSRSTVQRSLRALTEMGLLTIVPQYVLQNGQPRRTSSLYVLTLPVGHLRARTIRRKPAAYERHNDPGNPGVKLSTALPFREKAPTGWFGTDAEAAANAQRQLALLSIKGMVTPCSNAGWNIR